MPECCSAWVKKKHLADLNEKLDAFRNAGDSLERTTAIDQALVLREKFVAGERVEANEAQEPEKEDASLESIFSKPNKPTQDPMLARALERMHEGVKRRNFSEQITLDTLAELTTELRAATSATVQQIAVEAKVYTYTLGDVIESGFGKAAFDRLQNAPDVRTRNSLEAVVRHIDKLVDEEAKRRCKEKRQKEREERRSERKETSSKRRRTHTSEAEVEAEAEAEAEAEPEPEPEP